MCEAALAEILSNASQASQCLPPVAEATQGPLLNDALTFVRVLTGLRAAGVSAPKILGVITTVIDLIKVYGPDIATIVAAILKLLSGM